ncbi:PE domain-containing protein [Nocardia stercoris]|nr:PE domain-containing protein [Nocardia stercoris]
MGLTVIPSELPGVCGQLTVHYTNLVDVIKNTANAALSTTAMGSDLVSGNARVAFGNHVVNFTSQAGDGATHLFNGAQALIPVSQDYADTDGSGGAVVTLPGESCRAHE